MVDKEEALCGCLGSRWTVLVLVLCCALPSILHHLSSFVSAVRFRPMDRTDHCLTVYVVLYIRPQASDKLELVRACDGLTTS